MLELYVPNADEVHKRAIEAGCRELQPVIDAHWEPLRFGSVEDPAFSNVSEVSLTKVMAPPEPPACVP